MFHHHFRDTHYVYIYIISILARATNIAGQKSILAQPCWRQMAAISARSWTYSWTEGDATSEWTLLLENGVWCFIVGTDGIRRLVDTAAANNLKYYYSAALRGWLDLDAHPRSRQLSQWIDLADLLLPYLNSILESGEWRARTVKEWSHHGATRKYGDVGNRCMMLIVDTALELNRRVGVPRCWQVEQRNMEHKADLLEAVMGLRELNPTTHWAAWGDMVDDICTDVHEAWSSPELVNVWDQTVLTQALFARFGLDDFCAWHYQAAKSKSRMAAHAALQLRLRMDLVKLICRFL